MKSRLAPVAAQITFDRRYQGFGAIPIWPETA
jgi:hypothetical protein